MRERKRGVSPVINLATFVVLNKRRPAEEVIEVDKHSLVDVSSQQ
jgi:hypothetical protein